jgi:hypothetical protein
MDAAAYVEIAFDMHFSRLDRPDEIIEDLVGDGFVKSPFVPEAP